MSGGPARVAAGLLTDASRPIDFRFDGRAYRGLAGDTLASALLANGRQLFGRSFKYHRPRGVVTAGAEEPCALVDVLTAAGREPNRAATTLAVHAGLEAVSQNRWPALGFDVLAVNDLLSPFLPAGFYYKTFMSPGWAWERVYEPLIRRAAGLGTLASRAAPHAAPAETVHDHTDVLVVGAGTAGMSAAAVLGAAGLKVLLTEQDTLLGGGALLEARWDAWRAQQQARLSDQAGVRALTRTAVLGAYGHGVFVALETLGDNGHAAAGGLRERLRVIRARRVLLATGASERLIAFPGNDVPGVMLTGAARAYLRRYGVAAGHRPVFFVNNDEAYETLFALHAAGIAGAAVVDVRLESAAAARARQLGAEVFAGATVTGVRGRCALRCVYVTAHDGSRRELAADCLLISGGFTPAASLATQLGAALTWHEPVLSFVPELAAAAGSCAGALRGVQGLAAAARDGAAAALALAAELTGVQPPANAVAGGGDLPADPETTPSAPLWEVAGRGKAFVDLQNDVTAADVRLSHREGYEHVEHMKRYTTHGMATDQGRIGGLVGSAVLARARDLPVAAVGQLHARPYVQPVPFAALAGSEVREHYKPTRRLALHQWHERAGATFVPTGLWLRPLVYAQERGWEPVLKEARAVRRAVGVSDVSTLGKIDVQGKDAARFLDFVYANTFSTLGVGRARYGIMLREDGMLFDDGTTSRLGAEHFLVTTTTANSTAVLEHMEFHRQSSCAQLDVVLSDVGEQWAQFAVAGPRARELLQLVVSGCDLSNEAFPFMAVGEARIAAVAARLFRISFSGELAYEVAVPASAAEEVWSALLDAGRPLAVTPYGLDALNTLRIEKGHVTGAELNGNTGAHDLGFERLLKKQGDFIGRVLAQRPALTSCARLQLIGVRPRDSSQRLRNGMQLVTAEAPTESLGYITSSTPSVELEGWVGLALLAGGRARIGSPLVGTSPLHGEHIELDIVSPHMLDPENSRVRS
jgi:heterotetrameric sarcosine oxidase alpha subunit